MNAKTTPDRVECIVASITPSGTEKEEIRLTPKIKGSEGNLTMLWTLSSSHGLTVGEDVTVSCRF